MAILGIYVRFYSVAVASGFIQICNCGDEGRVNWGESYLVCN